jgi:hypothetical protein
MRGQWVFYSFLFKIIYIIIIAYYYYYYYYYYILLIYEHELRLRSQ